MRDFYRSVASGARHARAFCVNFYPSSPEAKNGYGEKDKEESQYSHGQTYSGAP